MGVIRFDVRGSMVGVRGSLATRSVLLGSGYTEDRGIPVHGATPRTRVGFSVVLGDEVGCGP